MKRHPTFTVRVLAIFGAIAMVVCGGCRGK